MQIKHFSFSVSGLKVSTNTNTIALCPRATCELLKSLNQIEDFTSDSNGEPVILISDSSLPTGYDYEMWCYFVQSFTMSKEMIRLLIQHLDDTISFARQRAMIAHLLAPCSAA